MNSDFNLGFSIRRDVLHSVLTKTYGIATSFEPCIYPGVKMSFMWNHVNTSMNRSQDGRCRCDSNSNSNSNSRLYKRCKGNGNGYGVHDCRRVTCAIFQSGCTIITGAQSYKQLEDTYKFVCHVIARHRADIEKEDNLLLLLGGGGAATVTAK